MKNIFLALIQIIIFSNSSQILADITAQADTVKVPNVNDIPVIDGKGNDACWLEAEWQNIDEFWIEYGLALDSTDFTGRYKLIWSSATNLLYFHIEVNDDEFIDGWPEVAGDYYHFDIIEIFLDPDKSGGLHVFDGTGQTGVDWGTNAENAFSYHINIDLPDSGGISTEKVVNDIAGTDWGDRWNPDFADHFPEMALIEDDGKYFWEFSLKVYDDSYDYNNPEASLMTLEPGNIMGLSLAYCDNDGVDEDPKTRDNFIGSVWVPEEKYNDHWMDADGYGVIELLGKYEPPVQDDPVEVTQVVERPIINADANDECWQDTKWQPISQVWIDYGEVMDAEDFSGQYKVVWSLEDNLLYFLVEITDDVFVDGYVYDSNPSVGGGYPNYDIVEVFIDHDNSGGLHVFDGTGNTGQQWGTNAENAFSYHIAADLLPNSQITTEKVVCDIAGVDWGNYFIPNYTDHLPEFAMTQREDRKYIWEFSLAVYEDTYDQTNSEASRVVLSSNDLMGLSIAYCDNDDPDEEPKERDNFIGSVWVPKEEYNDHWMNANGFGSIQLKSNLISVDDELRTVNKFELKNNYPNPFNPETIISYTIQFSDNVKLKIYDVMGREVATLLDEYKNSGSYKIRWNGKNNSGYRVSSGIYFYMIETRNYRDIKKMTLLK